MHFPKQNVYLNVTIQLKVRLFSMKVIVHVPGEFQHNRFVYQKSVLDYFPKCKSILYRAHVVMLYALNLLSFEQN